MRKYFCFAALFTASVYAQAPLNAPPPQPIPGWDPVSVASRQLEMFNRLATSADGAMARQQAERREATFARQQFCDKANQFVTLWLRFADRMNQGQSFDAKEARKLAKAFHELEKSDGWPVGRD